MEEDVADYMMAENYGSNNRGGDGSDWEENDFGQNNQGYKSDDRHPDQ